MNFLAHAYLSFDQPSVLTGNMISDYVKGKKKFDYKKEIQKGIELHRLIDRFTDNHPVNNEAKELFRPAYRLYAGAFVDVIYDHFLANDQIQFATSQALKIFSQNVYTQLFADFDVLPSHFQQMLPYMKNDDWLYNYKSEEGLERSLGGLRRRALYIKEIKTALDVFYLHKPVLQNCYDLFFPELKKYSEQQLRNLLDS